MISRPLLKILLPALFAYYCESQAAADPWFQGSYLGPVRFLGGAEGKDLNEEERYALIAIDGFLGRYSEMGASIPERLELFVYRDPQSSAFFDQINTVYFPFRFLRVVNGEQVVFDRQKSLGVALHEVGHSLSKVGWRESSPSALTLYDKRSKGTSFTSREMGAFNWLVGLEEWFSDVVGWVGARIEMNDLATVFMSNSRRFECSKSVEVVPNSQEAPDEPHGYFADTRCMLGDMVKQGVVRANRSMILKIEKGLEQYVDQEMVRLLDVDNVSVEEQNLKLKRQLIKWLN